MILTLIRHPETSWNKLGLLQGLEEGEITDSGKEDAFNLVNKYKDKPDHIFSAESQRCLFLAKIFSKKLDLPIQIDNRLNERSFGEFEGHNSLLIANKIGWSNLSSEEKFHRKPKGGESMFEVSQKIKSLVDEYQHIFANQAILCITSGGTIKSFLWEMGIITLDELYQTKINNLQSIVLTNNLGMWKMM